MKISDLIRKYETIIYISKFDYITKKHMELLKVYEDKIIILTYDDALHQDWKLYDKNGTLLLAQTSCKELNHFFSLKKLKLFKKVLFQDGIRLRKHISVKFLLALAFDKLCPKYSYLLSTTYYKKMYDYYFITSNEAYKEVLQYKVNTEKIYLIKNNSQIKTLQIDNLNLKEFILIDQPIEIYYKEKTQEIYDSIANWCNKNDFKIYIKAHPSKEYNIKYRANFDMLEKEKENQIYLTFFSSLGFELIQKGHVVFFLREFIPKQFIIDFNNFFIVNNFDDLYPKLNILFSENKSRLENEQMNLLKFNRIESCY
jgi:hypothetical protein